MLSIDDINNLPKENEKLKSTLREIEKMMLENQCQNCEDDRIENDCGYCDVKEVLNKIREVLK